MRTKYTQKDFNSKPVSRKYAVGGDLDASSGAELVLYALDPAGLAWDVVFDKNALDVDLAWVEDSATLNSVPEWRIHGLDDRGNVWNGVIAGASGNPDNLIVTDLYVYTDADAASDELVTT